MGATAKQGNLRGGWMPTHIREAAIFQVLADTFEKRNRPGVAFARDSADESGGALLKPVALTIRTDA